MNQLIRMFCEIDDYGQIYELSCQRYLTTRELKDSLPHTSMALSEIMTMVVYFHHEKLSIRCGR